MTSLCESCYAPGQCCKRIAFYNGDEVTFWLDENIHDQLRTHFHAEDKDRPQPFRVTEITSIDTSKSGRPYGAMVFNCANLLPNGRCGDYENRPWLCRVFEPGQDHLCVHYRGAEAGAE